MNPAIEIQGLSKRFPKSAGYRDILTFWRRRYITALNGVSLQVPRGGVFGLLGPNGAGKTTILKILAGLVIPDAGWVKVNGLDLAEQPAEVKNQVAYVSSEERSLYWRLTGRENLKFFGVLNDIPRTQVARRVAEVLSIVGIEDVADGRVGAYSSGIKQRLSIARGLLASPEVLLLDEPTRSLDPLSARRMWQFINDELVERQGKTIVMATHNMEEVSALCHSAAILHRGVVRVTDTVDALVASLTRPDHYVITIVGSAHAGIEQLNKLDGVQSVRATPPNGHRDLALEVVVDDPEVHIPLVVEHLVQAGARILEVNLHRATLGDTVAALADESQ